MKRFIPLLLLACPVLVNAAVCGTSTARICGPNLVCIDIAPPTKRQSDVNGVQKDLPQSEIKSYKISLNGTVIATPTSASYDYVLKPSETLPAGVTWGALAVDTDGREGAAMTCTSSTAVSYQAAKVPPAAPSGLRVF